MSWSLSFVLNPPLWGELDAKPGRPWNIIHCRPCTTPGTASIHSNFLGPLGPQAPVESEVGQSRHFPPTRDFRFQPSRPSSSSVKSAPHSALQAFENRLLFVFLYPRREEVPLTDHTQFHKPYPFRNLWTTLFGARKIKNKWVYGQGVCYCYTPRFSPLPFDGRPVVVLTALLWSGDVREKYFLVFDEDDEGSVDSSAKESLPIAMLKFMPLKFCT